MAELITIARPYAEAVFALADRAGTLAVWSGVLERLALAAADPAVGPVLGNPRIGDAQRVDLFLSIAGADTPEVRNFVAALAANGRLEALPQVREVFEALKNEREGTVEADIATAFPLGADDLATVVAGLEKRFGRKVQPSVRVDTSLIGGVRIAVGDEVIESSVRGRLAAMRSALASGS
jgi:F-type H+-transporting ATPase subunit delta